MALDEELEAARKRKLEDMQKRQDADSRIKTTLRAILDDAAYDRMVNVGIANPELYSKAAQGCVSIYQRIGRKLGSKEVLLVLRRMKGEDEGTKITFERK